MSFSKRLRFAQTLAASSLLISKIAAAAAPGTYVAFVTCPLIRDTAAQPCWMARNERTLYFLSTQEGLTYNAKGVAPELKHKMLVEGVVSDAKSVCDGVPLEKVKISPLPAFSPECNTKLSYWRGQPPQGRPIGPERPAGGSMAFVGGPPKFYDEADVAERRPKHLDVKYTFDSDYLMYPRQQDLLNQAIRYAKAIKAREIKIMALRGASLLSNGKLFVEDDSTPALRTANVLGILEASDLSPEMIITSTARSYAEPAKGEGDDLSRRLEIDILP